MIGSLSDVEVQVAIVTVAGSIIVAVVGAAVAWLGRQNSKQHGEAAAERAKDRQRSEEYREQLDARLGNLHTDVVQVRDIIVEHITDHEAHGRG